MSLPPEIFARCVRAARGILDKHGGKPLVAPINIELIARGCGFSVVRIHSAGDELSGLVSPRHKLIGVNGNHHAHRQRFTVAHEIGHILLNHPPESRCTAKQIGECNREADVCASELLIPTQLLTPHLFQMRATAAGTLSKLFAVSEEAMVLKMQHIHDYRRVMNGSTLFQR